VEIIDHHKLGSLETMVPISFRNQPVGCTATILYEMYGEQKLEISPSIAGLLCAAIISDTLMFRSPTCTLSDKMAAGALALIAGINIEQFAKEMFKAGSNLKDKSPEEIFSIVFSFFYSFTIVSRPQNNPQPFMYCINRLFLSADTFPLTKRNSPK
jgi:manganese-dependent inorganic pyrophosphatase